MNEPRFGRLATDLEREEFVLPWCYSAAESVLLKGQVCAEGACARTHFTGISSKDTAAAGGACTEGGGAVGTRRYCANCMLHISSFQALTYNIYLYYYYGSMCNV